MSGSDEVAALYAEFVDALHEGREPELDLWIARCPEAHRDSLRSALEFARAHGLPASGRRDRYGEFSIGDEIGRGAMGIVFEAHQPSLNRPVALKVLAPWLASDEAARTRLAREAQLMARLEHPNVVRVYATGEENGEVWIAMERVEGRPLDRVLRDAKPALPELLLWFEGLAAGLHTAHELGLVHRDVKPSNILIDSNGGPRLLDFGLARDLQASRSASTGFQGSPGYASPEQIEGRPVDGRSDVYSLGVVLYEATTGTPAFSATSIEQLFHDILAERFPRPREAQPTLPRDLETVVLKAMRRDPQMRYASAAELAADLAAIRELRPIAAREPRVAERARRWARTNRGFAAAIATALIATVVFLVRMQRDQRILSGEQRARAIADRRYQALLPSYQSRAEIDKDPSLAVALAIIGARTHADPTTCGALYAAMDALHERARFELEAPVLFVSWRSEASVVAVDERGGVYVLDQNRRTLRAHRAPGTDSAIHAAIAGDRVAVITADRKLVLHELDTEAPPQTIATDVVSAEPIGEHRMLVVNAARNAHVLRREGLVELARLDIEPTSCEISPNRRSACIAGEADHLVLLDLTTGQTRSVAHGHDGAVARVRFTPNGRAIVTSGFDRSVRWHDIDGGGSRSLLRHEDDVRDFGVAASGRHVASVGDDRTLRIWDAVSASTRRVDLAGEMWPTAVAFCPIRDELAIAREDGTIEIFDLPSGQRRATLRGHETGARALRFDTQGERLLSGGDDRRAIVWNRRSRGAMTSFRVDAELRACAFDRAGKRLLLLSNDGSATKHEIGLDAQPSEERVFFQSASYRFGGTDGEYLSDPRSGVRGLDDDLEETLEARSDDGRVRAVLAPRSSRIRLIRDGTGCDLELPSAATQRESSGGRQERTVTWLDFTDDGTRLAVGVRDGRVLLLETSGIEEAADARFSEIDRHTGPVRVVACLSDGRVASVSAAHTARIASSAPRDLEPVVLRGHTAPLTAVVELPEHRIATASEDGTARVFDTRSGEVLLVLRGPGPAVVDLALSPDGRTLATACQNGTAKLWPVNPLEDAIRVAPRRLSPSERERFSVRETDRYNSSR